MPPISRRTAIGTGLALAAAGAVGYSFWPGMDGYSEEAGRQRQLLGSDPGLEELVRMATLAANSHNTQPWLFRLTEGKVSILPDFLRRTPVVDPDDHHLFVSLGCAAENLVIAASATGQGSEVAIGAGDAPRIDLSLSPALPVKQGLYQDIPLRQSTRSVYDGQPVLAADMALLSAAARQEGVSVLFFTTPSDRDAILEFVVQGNSAQMEDPAFVRELRQWLRFSPARAIETGDGLFGACSGNPVLPEWIGPTLFGMAFGKAAETDKYRDQIRSSAGIAVFVGDRADAEHWIKVGRSFQRFALQATALGIRTTHVNQPVEVASVRPEFARWLGIPDARLISSSASDARRQCRCRCAVRSTRSWHDVAEDVSRNGPAIRMTGRRWFLGGLTGIAIVGTGAVVGMRRPAPVLLASVCEGSPKMSRRVLVAYSTRTGSIAEVAAAVARRLCAAGLSADVRPVSDVAGLDGYDGAILGSAIRYAAWPPEMIGFLTAYREAFAKEPVAFFTMHMLSLDDDPAAVANRAAYTATARQAVTPIEEAVFAGKIDAARLSFGDRLAVRLVKSPIGDRRDWVRIEAWADGLAERLA